MYNKIKNLGRSKRLTIARIERDCGLKPRTICVWDEHRPSVDKVAAVAKYLNVTVDELIREE